MANQRTPHGAALGGPADLAQIWRTRTHTDASSLSPAGSRKNADLVALRTRIEGWLADADRTAETRPDLTDDDLVLVWQGLIGREHLLADLLRVRAVYKGGGSDRDVCAAMFGPRKRGPRAKCDPWDRAIRGVHETGASPDLEVRRSLVRLNKKPKAKPGEEPPPRWKLEPPKTPKSRRAIPIPRAPAQELSQHRRAQAQQRLRRGPHWEDRDLVFPGRLGQPQDWNNISQRAFKEILKSAELPNEFSPYALRHTCASLLLAAGEPSKVIAERLGHTSTAITDDVYSHLSPGMQERATDRLGEFLYERG